MVSQRGNPLQWRHNGRDSVSNHQPCDCLLNRLFRRRSKKTSKLRVSGLCVGNSPGTGEFPAQMASNAENVSIWWRHHASWYLGRLTFLPLLILFALCGWIILFPYNLVSDELLSFIKPLVFGTFVFTLSQCLWLFHSLWNGKTGVFLGVGLKSR